MKLRPLDTPPRVLGALAERHEPKEELARRFPGVLPETVVDLLGPPRERAGDAADRAVRVRAERASLATLVELGQRVLEQGQRAGLVRHVGDELRDQTRLEPGSGPLRGSCDCTLELLRPQRDDRLEHSHAGNHNSVVATGGGTFADPNNRDLINRDGVSVWLDAANRRLPVPRRG